MLPPLRPRLSALLLASLLRPAAGRIGYIWLMVLASVAGLVVCLLSVFAKGSALGFLLGLALLYVGYWAWRRGYRAVQLVLTPEQLRVLPVAPDQSGQDIPISSIASHLRPQQSYYQILWLLHNRAELNFSKRLRTPPAGTLAFDDWANQLALSLEQARPTVVPDAPAPANGLLPGSPLVFARTAFDKVLAGLAVVCLLLAGLAALGSAHVPSAVFLGPVLYLEQIRSQCTVGAGLVPARQPRRINDYRSTAGGGKLRPYYTLTPKLL